MVKPIKRVKDGQPQLHEDQSGNQGEQGQQDALAQKLQGDLCLVSAECLADAYFRAPAHGTRYGEGGEVDAGDS